MKILVLCSGGDAPGMNKFISQIHKAFKSQVYFAFAGFTGLVNNQIYPLSEVVCKGYEKEAGAIIRSSRCPEFKDQEVFVKGLENAKKFDCVIVLGGNGSEKGAKQLYENGVNTIFIPATIDNDVDENSFTIGFLTAVKECVYAVNNTMPSIKTFGHSCLFEVMGREHAAIALSTAEIVGADYVINDKKSLDYEKIKNIILQKYIKGQSACIILRENISKVENIAKKLNQLIGINLVKFQVVGRTQRGGAPTTEELALATRFAKETIKCIKSKVFGVRVLSDKNKNMLVKEFK